MTQEEFKKEAMKQKRFINWMINGRERISKKLDELANERYSHLIGKFFVPKENFHHLDKDELYFISSVYTVSNYVGSSTIYVILNLRTLSKTLSGNNVDEVVGLSMWSRQAQFEIDDDLDELIGKYVISGEDACRNYIVPDTFSLIKTVFQLDEDQDEQS